MVPLRLHRDIAVLALRFELSSQPALDRILYIASGREAQTRTRVDRTFRRCQSSCPELSNARALRPADRTTIAHGRHRSLPHPPPSTVRGWVPLRRHPRRAQLRGCGLGATHLRKQTIRPPAVPQSWNFLTSLLPPPQQPLP